MATPRPPLTRSQRIRYTIYAAGVTVFFLVALDTTIRVLESRGAIDLARDNDRLWRPSGDPWVLGADGVWSPDTASDNVVRDHRFKDTKGDAFRVFFIGESMLRGVPYQEVGTIDFWFKRELAARFPGRSIEVVNGSMSAINSARVKQNVGYALAHSPDLLVVQSCNNEGTLQPSKVTERLHDLGTFRAFRKMLRGESDDEVPTYTPQDPDIAAVRTAYRDNVRELITAAQTAKVPLILVMSPLNLRYEGLEAGLPMQGQQWEQNAVGAATSCVSTGIALYKQKSYAEAERVLRGCEEVEALRWLGLSQFGQGDMVAAKASLEAYTELVPRNRCRRSFQAVFREEASNQPGVILVDLDALLSKDAPGGILGPEIFTDYCHLFWEAQGRAADALLSAMTDAGLGPKGAPTTPHLPPRLDVVNEATAAGQMGLLPVPLQRTP